MTIDERLDNIAQQLEIITGMQHAAEVKMQELDARERKGRVALLQGIAAYLEALNKEGGDE